MRIEEIVKEKQPGTYQKLKKKPKKKKKKENLSFEDIEALMRHDSFERHRGAVSQRTWGR